MNAKLFSAALSLALGFATPIFAQIGNNPTRTNNPTAAIGNNPATQPGTVNGVGNNVSRSRIRVPGGVSGGNNFNVGNGASVSDASYAAPVSDFGNGGGYQDFGNGGYGYSSSTAGEGYLKGLASAIGATGYAVEKISEANINNEVARSLALDNDYKYAETFWSKRALNREYAATERAPALSSDTLRQLARTSAPERLSVMQLSPATGQISWPAVLKRRQFDDMRWRIEDAFAARNAMNGGVGSSTDSAVYTVANVMQQELLEQIDSLSSHEYIAGKNFLRSLAYEARFVPAAEGVARR